MSQRELTIPSGSAGAKAWNWLAQSLTQHDQMTAYFEPLIQIVLPQWTTTGYRSKVVQVRRETADVYTLVIKPSGRWPQFTPGQYLEITAERDGARQSRYFSISCSPKRHQLIRAPFQSARHQNIRNQCAQPQHPFLVRAYGCV